MLWNLGKAFLAGGALCTVGQLLIDRTGLTPARILSLYVTAGVLFEAVGLYGSFSDWAGAGASVPLLGFGSALADGVREAVAENGWIGAFTGGVTRCAGGITAAIFFGYLTALLCRPKAKR